MTPEPLSAIVDPVVDLADRLRMDRTARARGAVVVEGPDDEEVLSRAFAIDARRIFSTSGRNNLLRLARQLATSPLSGVTCVADRDLDNEGVDFEQFSWFVFYDDADLESMLAATGVFDRFIREWGSGQKIEAVGGAEHLRARLVAALQPLTALRSRNAERGWGYRFKEADVEDLFDLRTLEFSTLRLVARMAAATPLTNEQLSEAAASTVATCPHTGRRLVRGKDLMVGVDIALRKVVGSRSKQQVSDSFSERVLRLMVGRGDLDATQFGSRFREARRSATEAHTG